MALTAHTDASISAVAKSTQTIRKWHLPLSPLAFAGLQLIFVIGLPRSGTTLVNTFIKEHAEVLGLLDADRLSATDEWAPASAYAYGGSKSCLGPMCGEQENSYLHLADYDHARWNCTLYAERALWVAQKAPRATPSGEAWRFVQKHPANLLRPAWLAQSCADIGVRATFVEVERSAADWNNDDVSCTGSCRDAVINNSRACMNASHIHVAPNTYVVRFEDFGTLATWRNLEAWLNLSRIEVAFRDKLAPIYSHNGRQLVLHGNAGHGVNNTTFTVFMGFILMRCPAQPDKQQWKKLLGDKM